MLINDSQQLFNNDHHQNHDKSPIDTHDQIPTYNKCTINLKGQIEGIIFASPDPINLQKLGVLLGAKYSSKQIKSTLAELINDYKLKADSRSSGIVLKELYNGYQFQTSTQLSDIVKKMFLAKPKSLSSAVQETLAIIAYRQPVTRADIEYIRGVDVGAILKKLVDKELIQAVISQQTPGRALLYSTTNKFLIAYDLKSINDLPPISSFQPSMEKIAISDQLIKNSSINNKNSEK